MANLSETSEIDTNGRPSFSCELAAWNVTRLSLPELLALRKQPASRFPAHITPQFLKNSDDQTVATLASLYAAVGDLGQSCDVYRDWAVISASQYIGRGTFAGTLHKYCKDGPWGVSVQVIPHNMLHSISSTISLTLPCVGPCLGAGGGANGEVDALLIATNLLSSGEIPGAWVTWSTWDPELAIDEAGKPTSESSCVTVALALRPITVQIPRAKMTLGVRGSRPERLASSGERVSGQLEAKPASNSLMSVLQQISDLKPKSFDIVCQLRGGLDLELSWCEQPNGIAATRMPEAVRRTSGATA